METRYNRAAEDLGNIVGLEHVNLAVSDPQLAMLFYVSGLGLTRDPFIMVGADNMWINVGRSQFHLPTRAAQILRGHTGIVLPDRAALLRRLTAVSKRLEGTRFSFSEHEGYVEATCPWGNTVRCYEPNVRFGPTTLGIPYVEFNVPIGSADGIARFYQQIMEAPASVTEEDGRRVARVCVGSCQDLMFRETDRELPPYDGHHIQVYVANFSGPHRHLQEKKLITEESDQHQYRFKDLIDPDSGDLLFTIEHEVRSMRHPLYMRPLVNRNPSQTNTRYAPGHDALIWATAENP